KEEFRAKILIVDDEPSILDIYAEFLSRRNFSVAKALNSEEALEIYSTFKPDIVLTDIKMPVMDGFQLSRQIKEINPEQRIVMMTGFDFEPEVRNQLEKNNYPYFTKPADLEGTVLRVIKEEISRMKR
ncbi:MAG: response regulator, partial [Fidelibacterota bacterium]